MRRTWPSAARRIWIALATLALAALGPGGAPAGAEGRDAFLTQNEALFERLQEVHGLTDDQMASVREVFGASGFAGQGNPAVAKHPATPEQCRSKLSDAAVTYENGEFERLCGHPYMAPLYDTETQTTADATACIDQFEFPDIPCEYPVVWVRASEAAELCRAMGKRLCDAHEWEGACAGSLQPPDYRFDLAAGKSAEGGAKAMRDAHNAKHGASKSWAYGPEYRKGVCAAASTKTAGCEGGGWTQCGSNTYPTGMFPGCASALGVYDQHGNAAEHMSLPLAADQMSSTGSDRLGYTEMKGSWFIWDSYYAHQDWCRWRAPYWHGSRVTDPKSHHNYHLGFRCCATIPSGVTAP